jgi:hypothetical protein
MIENIPFYIPFIFILTTFLCLLFFYRACQQSRTVLIVMASWLVLQGIVGFIGFYTVTDTIPPRLALLAGPAILFVIVLFFTSRGRTFIDSLDTKWLTYLHLVRIPVEICLLWLFIAGQVPQLMTFEGRNFDILSGISAPFIAFYGYKRQKISRSVLILWNIVCLGLLINIVAHAILSAPFPFQQLAFDQPNRAVLYFPFVWLPGFIVPVVLFSHLVCLRQLLSKPSNS